MSVPSSPHPTTTPDPAAPPPPPPAGPARRAGSWRRLLVPDRPAGGVRRHRTRAWPLAGVAVVLAWLLVLVLGLRVQPGPAVQDLARFGHLAALVLGFGAALTVEWFGLLWVLRRRPLAAVTQVAQGAHLPIWLGLVGLAATGVVLLPDQLTVPSLLKLLAVLVVALNGIAAARMQRRLDAAGPAVPRSLQRWAAGTALVSQLGWWSAVTIGYVNAHS